ncbi:MAG: hypothetical protein IH600_08025 [Bacteroidetes bacterium]|nr:hypothetical protein [Bacteroidota bacterium]
MKFPLSPITLLLVSALTIAACGGEKKPEPDPNARQAVNIPLAENQPNAINPVEVPEENLPDLSGLTEIERQIFKRSVALQVPYYDEQYKWAERANTINDGQEAAAALKEYMNIQNRFARSMQQLDLEFSGKLDPNYAGSKAFDKAIDQYMNDPNLMKRLDFIVESVASLMKRFKNDPACKSILAEVERLARQSQ